MVDFGVAKLRGAPELTAVNTIVGTVPYMAPEQLMGGVLDGRVDQYALAVIAYEMLAGEMAFDGSGAVADVARRVLTHVPPFVAGVPQAVNEVIFRGMSRGAAERYASVTEFVTALQQAAKVNEPSLPDAAPQDELPPLAGEATRITVAAGDASAPPTPTIRPRRRPRTRRRRRSRARRRSRPRCRSSAGRRTRCRWGARRQATTRPPTSARPCRRCRRWWCRSCAGVARRQPSSPLPPSSEPRVTLKTMNAATAPSGWEAVAGDPTKSICAPSRWMWILCGVLFGIVAALGPACSAS